MIIDGLQLFFCFCYLFRACYIKIWNRKQLEKYEKQGRMEGYSNCCSIMTDLLVVSCFIAKFYFS